VPAPFSPSLAEIRGYLKVLPALTKAATRTTSPNTAPARLSRAELAQFAHRAGFTELDPFLKTQAAVMAAYACLLTEKLRDELAATLPQAPGKLAAEIQTRIAEADAKLANLRRLVTPETIASIRPLLPMLNRILTAPPPEADPATAPSAVGGQP